MEFIVIVATKVKEKQKNKDKSRNEKEYDENNLVNNNNTNEKDSKNNDKKQKNIIDDLEQKILSSVDINEERDISNPAFGIELLRSLAIKSASNNDIDVTNACLTGLFKILTYILKNQDVFGLPFTIKVKTVIKRKERDNDEKFDDDNEKKYSKKRKKILSDNNSNIHDDKNKKISTSTITNTSTSKFKENKNDDDNKLIRITIKPKEEPLTDILFTELSIINNRATKLQNIPILKHFISEYISTSKTLLENGKKEKFYLFTNWYSQELTYSLESLSKEFQNKLFVSPLLDFQNYLSQNYEYAKTSFEIYMKNIIKLQQNI